MASTPNTPRSFVPRLPLGDASARGGRSAGARPLLAFAALLISACEWSELVVLPREGTGVTRPGLTVTVVLEEEYAAFAEALGWEGGAVPGAEVAVSRRDQDVEWELTESDAVGVAEFPRLLPGLYNITAFRRLTEDEREALAEAGLDARVLGGGGVLGAPGPEGETRRVGVQPDEPGSLVFSEVSWRAMQIPPGVGGTYRLGFIELYNNSDTVIYLDGKLVGDGLLLAIDGATETCVSREAVRNNPAGLSARDIQRFPGSGRDFPLQPGELVTVATEAIDHTQFGSTLLDLSRADFEFDAPEGADNPHVPNMINVSLRRHFQGINFPANYSAPFVAEAVDVAGLETRTTPNGVEYVIIPGQRILDVMAHRHRAYPTLSRLCDELVHRNFDRLEAPVIPSGWGDGGSVQRRIVGFRDDGRAILQRTRTSALDAFYGPWTPFELPGPASGHP
jgi:hypothetical protein